MEIKKEFEELYEKILIEMGNRFGEHTDSIIGIIEKVGENKKAIKNSLRVLNADSSESDVYFLYIFSTAIENLKIICGQLKHALKADDLCK